MLRHASTTGQGRRIVLAVRVTQSAVTWSTVMPSTTALFLMGAVRKDVVTTDLVIPAAIVLTGSY